MSIALSDYVAGWAASPFGALSDAPWELTARAAERVGAAIRHLNHEYVIREDIAVHRSATIEQGAIVKGPALVGPRCFVAAGAYLRGGCFIAEDCIVGPGAELKSTYMFRASKLAHFNFVGDSIVGESVNLEAGAIVANYRNELETQTIRIATPSGVIDTGVQKFGALLGDGVRVGANAVIAPGAILVKGCRVPRLGHVDQYPTGPSA